VRNPPKPERASKPAAVRAALAAPLPVAPLDDVQRLACLRLIRSENVGPVAFRELINTFGGAQAALDALPEITARSRRGRAIRICSREDALRELDAARKLRAEPVFTIEPAYPAALAHVDVPPPMLYVVGRKELLNNDVCAIVGARNSSAAGTKFTRMIAARLGEAGYVIASGLARGIDGTAHEAALKTGTIAVLAGGPDFVYPPEHAGLQARIAEDGCLITEQPPGFQPRAQDFPRRNRIISGIALGVVVVEAARRSGTLITARTAGEQGRLVLAVPGHPLDPRSEGTNGLIRQGATMVTNAEDILEALITQSERTALRHSLNTSDQPPFEPALASASGDTVEQQPLERATASALERVAVALGPAPVDLDELSRTTGLAIREIRAAVLELSLAGLVEHHGSSLVSLRPSP